MPYSRWMQLAGGSHRLGGKVDRIGSHVGDVAVLVEALGHPHRVAGRESKLPVGLLLERRGGEGRRGAPDARLLLARHHLPGFLEQVVSKLAGLGFIEQDHLFPRRELAGLLVEILPGRDPVSAHADQVGVEREFVVEKVGLEVPIRRGAERAALPLPQHQQANRDRLDPAGRQSVGNLLPEKRAQGVAVEPVEDPSGFLGPDQPVIELPSGVQCLPDGLPGDFVEHHPTHLDLGGQHLAQVPRDAFAFPVFVGGEQELVGVLEQVLELLDHLLLVGGHHIERLEVLGDVDAEAGPLLSFVFGGDVGGLVGKIANVAHRCRHAIPAGQKLLDGLRFGGRFDDYQ